MSNVCSKCGQVIPMSAAEVRALIRKVNLAARKIDEVTNFLEQYEGENANIETLISEMQNCAYNANDGVENMGAVLLDMLEEVS